MNSSVLSPSFGRGEKYERCLENDNVASAFIIDDLVEC